MAALCLTAAGCHLPLLHPIRLREGPYVSVSASGQGGAGAGGGCDNTSGCTLSGGGAGGLSFPQLSAGYAHLFNPNMGFLVGGTMITVRDQRLDEWYAASSLVLFGTVQSDDEIAICGGVDLGAGAATLELAAEGTFYRFDPLWDIGLAVFARRTIPYDEARAPAPGSGFEFNPRVWSYELGTRIVLGPVFLEYSYFRLDRGFVYYEVWETAGFSEGLHMITLGAIADGRAFFEDRLR